MVFTKQQISNCAPFYFLAKEVNEIMPKYGERVEAGYVLEKYIETNLPESISESTISKMRKQLSSLLGLKLNVTITFDVTVALPTMSVIYDAIKRNEPTSGFLETFSLTECKCALAFARYYPEADSILSFDLPLLVSELSELKRKPKNNRFKISKFEKLVNEKIDYLYEMISNDNHRDNPSDEQNTLCNTAEVHRRVV